MNILIVSGSPQNQYETYPRSSFSLLTLLRETGMVS